MPRSRGDRGPGKEGDPQTQPMPLGELKEYVEWVKAQKPPTPKSKGSQPPAPKPAEPNDPGTKEPTE